MRTLISNTLPTETRDDILSFTNAKFLETATCKTANGRTEFERNRDNLAFANLAKSEFSSLELIQALEVGVKTHTCLKYEQEVLNLLETAWKKAESWSELLRIYRFTQENLEIKNISTLISNPTSVIQTDLSRDLARDLLNIPGEIVREVAKNSEISGFFHYAVSSSCISLVNLLMVGICTQQSSSSEYFDQVKVKFYQKFQEACAQTSQFQDGKDAGELEISAQQGILNRAVESFNSKIGFMAY